MARRKNPTTQEIQEQIFYASEGDKDALEWLRRENALMSKAANERMRYLERKGYVEDGKGTYAYNNAKEDLYLIGQEKFIYRKTMSLAAIEDNMIAARTFLESQTSTIRGELKRRKNIIAGLEKGGWIEFKDSKNIEKNKEEFLKFLDSDIFEDLFFLGSGPLISQGLEAIEKGAKVTDLVNMYKEYQERTDVDKFNLWDSWTKGQKKILTASELVRLGK